MTNYFKNNHVFLFFLTVNLLSLIGVWLNYQVSLVFSFLAFIYLLLNGTKVLGTLFSKNSFFFLLFLFFELISCSNYFLNSYSRSILIEFPVFLVQGISYIIIPQLLFYYLGFNNAKREDYKTNLFQITNLFAIAYLFGIYLHFFRPDYFNAFIERVILSDPNTGYKIYYPKLTIYWNSMIVGVLGVAIFWFSVFTNRCNLFFKAIYSLVFIISILFSTQRGAWLSFIISCLVFFLLNFNIKKTFKYFRYILLFYFFIVTIFNFIRVEQFQDIFQDVYNKFELLDGALNERSYQYDNFVKIIMDYPLGVGLGLLTNKAADLGLLLTTPDGNYYRIFGELGILGIISFVLLLINSLYKSYKMIFKLFFVILIVYIIQAVGTNVFDIYAASFLFWYIIGFVNGVDNITEFNSKELIYNNLH